MNLPAEEIASPSRLGFQLEQAFWFYDDFYRAENRALPKLNLKGFAAALLSRYPEWTQANGIGLSGEEAVVEFLQYKATVPTCGAILLNEDLNRALLVKGYHNNASWGFPKGKIAKGEGPEACAIREVAEEIGYDIGPLLRPEEYIQLETGPHAVRLYIIPGVREAEARFETRTRKEIGAIGWFPVGALDGSKAAAKFYNVAQVVGRLRAWIRQYRRGQGLEPEGSTGTILQQKKEKVAAKKPKAAKKAPEAIPKTILRKPVGDFKFDLGAIERVFLGAWHSK